MDYADSHAYLAAYTYYPPLTPIFTRWQNQELEDQYTQNFLYHFFISSKAYFEPLWPARPDLPSYPSRDSPELKRQLAAILQKRKYLPFKQISQKPLEQAKRELLDDNQFLSGLVDEIRSIQPPQDRTVIDDTINQLTTEADDLRMECFSDIKE